MRPRGDERGASAQGHRAPRGRRLVIADVLGAAVAQRSVTSHTPAAHVPAFEQRTREVFAGGELHRGAAELDEPDGGWSFVITHVGCNAGQRGEVSAPLVIAIPQPAHTSVAKPPFWAEMRAGLRYTAGWPGLMGILVMATAINFFLTAAISLLPILVSKHFGGAAMHPDNLERGSLGAGMRLPFALSVLTGLAAFLHLLLARLDLETRRARAAARLAGLASGAGG